MHLSAFDLFLINFLSELLSRLIRELSEFKLFIDDVEQVDYSWYDSDTRSIFFPQSPIASGS